MQLITQSSLDPMLNDIRHLRADQEFCGMIGCAVQSPPKPNEEDFQGAKETMPGNITSADNSPLRHTVSEKGGEANVDIPASMMKRNR